MLLCLALIELHCNNKQQPQPLSYVRKSFPQNLFFIEVESGIIRVICIRFLNKGVYYVQTFYLPKVCFLQSGTDQLILNTSRQSIEIRLKPLNLCFYVHVTFHKQPFFSQKLFRGNSHCERPCMGRGYHLIRLLRFSYVYL